MFVCQNDFMDLFPKEYKTKENGANIGSPGLGSVKFDLKSVDFSKLAGLGRSLSRLGTVICGALIIVSLLLWGGMFYYENTLEKQTVNLKEEQSKVFSPSDKETAAKIINLEKGSESAKALLASHIFVSELFDKISDATLPQVQWRSMELSLTEKSVALGGLAANYSVLAKQILALKESGFSGVAVDSIALDKLGGVDFGANFDFDPKILRKQ